MTPRLHQPLFDQKCSPMYGQAGYIKPLRDAIRAYDALWNFVYHPDDIKPEDIVENAKINMACLGEMIESTMGPMVFQDDPRQLALVDENGKTNFKQPEGGTVDQQQPMMEQGPPAANSQRQIHTEIVPSGQSELFARMRNFKAQVEFVELFNRTIQNLSESLTIQQEGAKFVGSKKRFEAAISHLEQATKAMSQGCAQELGVGT